MGLGAGWWSLLELCVRKETRWWMVWGSGLWLQTVHGCGNAECQCLQPHLLILFSFVFLPFPSSCRLPLRHAFDVRQCSRHCYSVVSVISPLLLPYLSSGTWTKACTLKCVVYHRALSLATTPFSLFSNSHHLVFCAWCTCLFHQGSFNWYLVFWVGRLETTKWMSFKCGLWLSWAPWYTPAIQKCLTGQGRRIPSLRLTQITKRLCLKKQTETFIDLEENKPEILSFF